MSARQTFSILYRIVGDATLPVFCANPKHLSFSILYRIVGDATIYDNPMPEGMICFQYPLSDRR